MNQDTTSQLDELYQMMVLTMLPILRPFFYWRLKKQREGSRAFTAHVLSLIRHHSFNGDVRNILDAVKQASDETGDAELAACGVTREHILLVSFDLYSAGMFDTSENSHWFIVLMAAHPEAQERLAGEILAVTGGSRSVESADQAEMPFSYACMLESFRYAVTSPFITPHRATEDVKIAKWTIPKGTDFVVNMWSVLRNPEIYPEPNTFKPERFLKDGRVSPEMNNNILLFGTGGRRCVGEAFARQQIFVVCLNILRHFRVELDPDTPGNALEHEFRINLQPGPHKLIFHHRYPSK